MARLTLARSVCNCAEEQEQLQSRISALMHRAPVWLAAQNSLSQLCEQSGEQFESSRDVTDAFSNCWSAARSDRGTRRVGARKRAVDDEIERLSQPGGSEDPRLNALAERLAAYCCRKSMMTSLDDAPYFSALYGPSRHAIVVPDLSQIAESIRRAGRLPGRSLPD